MNLWAAGLRAIALHYDRHGVRIRLEGDTPRERQQLERRHIARLERAVRSAVTGGEVHQLAEQLVVAGLWTRRAARLADRRSSRLDAVHPRRTRRRR